MTLGIELLLDDPLGAADGQLGQPFAQHLARLVGRQLDVGLGRGNLAIALGDGVLLGLLDDLVAALAGLVDDFAGFGPRFTNDLLGLLLGLFQRLLVFA